MTGQYEDRLLRVLSYIHDNPAGDLSLDALADVAAMSRFHWHRVFHALTGETCAEAVRRIRVSRAAFWLVQTDDPVHQIARRAGYENTDSFARVFKDQFRVSPSAFRRLRGALSAPVHQPIGKSDMYSVKVQDRSDMRLIAQQHVGPYQEISQAFEKLSAVVSSRGLWPSVLGTTGIYYDDPSMVAPADLRSHAGFIVGPDLAIPDDLEEVIVPGGAHAVLLLEGPYTGLPSAYDYLYGAWLASSSREPADRPSFEVYLNSPMDAAPADLRTEVCLPLKAA